jgi:4-hydroxybenzoate polyprenyltransferase
MGRERRRRKVNRYIRLIRPWQYVKNGFIFLPLFFAGKIADPLLLFQSGIAFAAFCLLASSVYVFNDYHDVEEDRNHPVKKNRPLASGEISGRKALVLMVVLLAGGLGVSVFLGQSVFLLFAFYLVLNFAYTLKLKHVPIVDVFVVALGFAIRLFVGSLATAVELSMWIVLITYLLALFLALAKRRSDVLIYVKSGLRTRKLVGGYNLEVLNAYMVISATVVLVSYIMYTVSPEVIAKAGTKNLYITALFVLFGIMRYLQISLVEKQGGSPTEVVLRDRLIQLALAGWFVSFGILLYS